MTNPDIERMRGDWNRRADENYRRYIAAGHAGSDDAFRTSGARDLDQLVLDGIELLPSAKVLEIGCGVGRLLVPLSERATLVFGVDISEVMIQRSREYTAERPNIRTTTTDGNLGDFDDSSLDLVYSVIVFQHIPKPAAVERYVEEAARVLRPGGLLRFQLDGRHRLRTRPDWSPDTYDGWKFSPGEARAFVRRAGLDVLEEWGAETHYFWMTARKGNGAEAAVSIRPRALDRRVLADVLERCGVQRVSVKVRRIARGSESIRNALAPLAERLDRLDNASLVREAYVSLLRREPDEGGLSFHVANLEADSSERGNLVDVILTSKEFRDLVMPVGHRAQSPLGRLASWWERWRARS